MNIDLGLLVFSVLTVWLVAAPPKPVEKMYGRIAAYSKKLFEKM